jgi:hypothetical protein
LWRVNTMIDWLVFNACFSSISALLWHVNTMMSYIFHIWCHNVCSI